MDTRNNSDLELRLVIRGKGGEVTSVKISERTGGGKFRPCDGRWTEQHAILARKFPKVALAVAKAAVPPFDADAIVGKVNASRRKKSNVPKKRPLRRRSMMTTKIGDNDPLRRNFLKN
jgi:hypothetical protein